MKSYHSGADREQNGIIMRNGKFLSAGRPGIDTGGDFGCSKGMAQDAGFGVVTKYNHQCESADA